MRIGKTMCGAVLAATMMTGPAAAATLNEADMPGGAFGAAWNTPTAIDPGVTGIIGTGDQNRYDNFMFGLPSGAQTISLSFAAPEGIGYSYAAGGNILWSEAPFRWSWDGATLAAVHTDYYTRAASVDLVLGPGFSGSLYLALNFTYGTRLNYMIGIPSNAAPVNDDGTVTYGPDPDMPAPVPLPAGAALLAGALGALALLRRRTA